MLCTQQITVTVLTKFSLSLNRLLIDDCKEFKLYIIFEVPSTWNAIGMGDWSSCNNRKSGRSTNDCSTVCKFFVSGKYNKQKIASQSLADFSARLIRKKLYHGYRVAPALSKQLKLISTRTSFIFYSTFRPKNCHSRGNKYFTGHVAKMIAGHVSCAEHHWTAKRVLVNTLLLSFFIFVQTQTINFRCSSS